MNPWLLGLAGGLLFGGELVRDFERAAARDVRSKLVAESGREIKVKVTAKTSLGSAFGNVGSVRIAARQFSTPGLPLFTEPERSQKGRLGRLFLDLSDFRLGELRVESLTAEIPNCRFDFSLAVSKKQFRLSKSGLGTGEVRLRAEDLAAFILKKYSEVKTCTVQFAGGKAIVEGDGELLLLQTKFRVEARLTPTSPTQLSLTDATMTFDGRPADDASRQVLLETLNPVVDLDKDLGLLDAMAIESVTAENNELTVRGKTKIPLRPAVSPGGTLNAWNRNREIRLKLR